MSRMVMKVYSAEFKADAVALYLSDPKNTFEGIGKDLGISRETLRNCVRAERGRAGHAAGSSGSPGAERTAKVTSDDVLKEENKQLRARIRELENAVLGERHIIDRPGIRADPRHQPLGDPPAHRHRIPGGLIHELLQVLLVAVRQPRGHGLDGLAATVHHQPSQIAVALGPLILARHRGEHIRHE